MKKPLTGKRVVYVVQYLSQDGVWRDFDDYCVARDIKQARALYRCDWYMEKHGYLQQRIVKRTDTIHEQKEEPNGNVEIQH